MNQLLNTSHFWEVLQLLNSSKKLLSYYITISAIQAETSCVFLLSWVALGCQLSACLFLVLINRHEDSLYFQRLLFA